MNQHLLCHHKQCDAVCHHKQYDAVLAYNLVQQCACNLVQQYIIKTVAFTQQAWPVIIAQPSLELHRPDTRQMDADES